MMIYAEKSEAALADHEWKRILETWISQVKQREDSDPASGHYEMLFLCGKDYRVSV